MAVSIPGLLIDGLAAPEGLDGQTSLQAANHDDPGVIPKHAPASLTTPAALMNDLASEATAALTRSTAASPIAPAEPIQRLERLGPFASTQLQPEPATTPLSTAQTSHDGGLDHGRISNIIQGVCTELLTEAAWRAAQGTAEATVSSGPVSLSTPLVDLAKTFRLHSNPGASKTIYLDFNGHTTSGTAWNSWNSGVMGASFTSPAYSLDSDASSFSSTELAQIQQIWQRVSADFSCFDVNVTTEAPPNDWLINSGTSDPNYGIRVVITSYGPSSGTSGGIAYINSFTWNSDTPCFVYNTSLLGVSEAISHEVGHTLGLAHDGTSSSSYYQGHGTGESSWAPIMGVGYYTNVTTWDSGIYYGSNNTGSTANYGLGADDLAIITANGNGFSYQTDTEGNSQSSATTLNISAGAVSQFGTIETASDSDWFRFDLFGTGSINLSFNPYVYVSYIDSDDIWGGSLSPWYATASDANISTSWVDNASNLDIRVLLRDSNGTILASSDPSGLAANLAISNLAAGTYYLQLDGVGFGDPTTSTPTGYSDYASIGDYLITGSITDSGTAPIPAISLALSASSVAEDGSSNLIFTVSRSVVSATSLTVNFTVSGTASNGSDYSGLQAGSTQTITFAANAATATIVIDPTADSSVEADETISLTLQAGTGYSLGATSSATGTIKNDDLQFTTGLDLLTGSTNSSETFWLRSFKDGLIGTGSTFSCDSITNFETSFDRIDTPSLRTTAITPKQLGSVSALSTTAISNLLNTKGAFSSNGASTFTYADPSKGTRTFLALNDSSTSFSASSDTIIEITGYTGSLSALQVF